MNIVFQLWPYQELIASCRKARIGNKDGQLLKGTRFIQVLLIKPSSIGFHIWIITSWIKKQSRTFLSFYAQKLISLISLYAHLLIVPNNVKFSKF